MYVYKIYTYKYLHIKSVRYKVTRAWRGQGTHLTNREGLEIEPLSEGIKMTQSASNSGFLPGGRTECLGDQVEGRQHYTAHPFVSFDFCTIHKDARLVLLFFC